ncbi:hypothetical protein [Actinomyces wuliandei]|uniref:hypothetical protein n=1 Tax=Actinomyces wuliandei TaxID=2057743 RepID=UPI00111A0553|nr:hypothetical protein [Actinomyces wuliandei]
MGTAAQAAGRGWLLHQVRSSHRRWRHSSGSTVFNPSWGLLLWEQVPPACAVTGIGITVSMIYFTADGPSYNSNGFALLWCNVHAGVAAYFWKMTPFTLPGRPAVCLTPEGVWLWPRTRRQAWVPWQDQPELIGQLIYDDAVITTSTSALLRFPMFCLPLGYNQLHRVLRLYTTHPELRHELAHPQGLDRVRTLMHTPVHQVEERLAGRADGSPG